MNSKSDSPRIYPDFGRRLLRLIDPTADPTPRSKTKGDAVRWVNEHLNFQPDDTRPYFWFRGIVEHSPKTKKMLSNEHLLAILQCLAKQKRVSLQEITTLLRFGPARFWALLDKLPYADLEIHEEDFDLNELESEEVLSEVFQRIDSQFTALGLSKILLDRLRRGSSLVLAHDPNREVQFWLRRFAFCTAASIWESKTNKKALKPICKSPSLYPACQMGFSFAMVVYWRDKSPYSNEGWVDFLLDWKFQGGIGLGQIPTKVLEEYPVLLLIENLQPNRPLHRLKRRLGKRSAILAISRFLDHESVPVPLFPPRIQKSTLWLTLGPTQRNRLSTLLKMPFFRGYDPYTCAALWETSVSEARDTLHKLAQRGIGEIRPLERRKSDLSEDNLIFELSEAQYKALRPGNASPPTSPPEGLDLEWLKKRLGNEKFTKYFHQEEQRLLRPIPWMPRYRPWTWYNERLRWILRLAWEFLLFGKTFTLDSWEQIPTRYYTTGEFWVSRDIMNFLRQVARRTRFVFLTSVLLLILSTGLLSQADDSLLSLLGTIMVFLETALLLFWLGYLRKQLKKITIADSLFWSFYQKTPMSKRSSPPRFWNLAELTWDLHNK